MRLICLLLFSVSVAQAGQPVDLVDVRPGHAGPVSFYPQARPVQLRVVGRGVHKDRVHDVRLDCESWDADLPDGLWVWQAYWIPPLPQPGLRNAGESGYFRVADGTLSDPALEE